MEIPQDAGLPKKPAAGLNESVQVYDVTRTKNPVARLTGNYSFEDLNIPNGIQCDWRFQPEATGLSVYGHLSGLLEVECARCLEPFSVPMNLRLEERFVFESMTETPDRERELQADDFYETLDDEGALDLKDLAHQFLILESVNHTVCQRPQCEFT